MVTQCTGCSGKKVIMGLGGMIKDCPKCGGVGHIKVVSNNDTIDDNKSVNTIKKRGRPKKSHGSSEL
jgi:predicted  nucleic acid-binding Zn-ribbon protein